MPVLTEEQLESAIAFCKEHHCQLSVHAMGTKTIAMAVDRLCREASWMREEIPSVRIEHVTDPDAESIKKQPDTILQL